MRSEETFKAEENIQATLMINRMNAPNLNRIRHARFFAKHNGQSGAEHKNVRCKDGSAEYSVRGCSYLVELSRENLGKSQKRRKLKYIG
jgi:uncharacterized protein YutD